MNANELADFVEVSKPDDKTHQLIATMLRQQQAEIEALKKLTPKKRTRQRNEEDAMFLGAVCRGSRAWLGWSQRELADKMGKCLTVVARIEQGESNPQYATVNKLMSIFEDNGIKISRDDKTFTLNIQRLVEK